MCAVACGCMNTICTCSCCVYTRVEVLFCVLHLQCTNFVKSYGPDVIEIITDAIDPKTECQVRWYLHSFPFSSPPFLFPHPSPPSLSLSSPSFSFFLPSFFLPFFLCPCSLPTFFTLFVSLLPLYPPPTCISLVQSFCNTPKHFKWISLHVGNHQLWKNCWTAVHCLTFYFITSSQYSTCINTAWV